MQRRKVQRVFTGLVGLPPAPDAVKSRAPVTGSTRMKTNGFRAWGHQPSFLCRGESAINSIGSNELSSQCL